MRYANNLPVIDAGSGAGQSPAASPRRGHVLPVLLVLLVVAIGVAVWIARAGLGGEPAEVAAPTRPPSEEEKARVLEALAESSAPSTEEERIFSLEALASDSEVPREEMEASLQQL